MRLAIVLIAACALSSVVSAKTHRDHKAVLEFKRSTPCPSTGKPRGVCPGYVVDHVKPLCAGGADSPTNMQWQTVQDSKIKDKQEDKDCRSLRNAPQP